MDLRILSDGKKDGIALTYVKDGIMYPVGLTEKQVEGLEIMLGAILGGELSVIGSPIAKVTDLISKKGEGQ